MQNIILHIYFIYGQALRVILIIYHSLDGESVPRFVENDIKKMGGLISIYEKLYKRCVNNVSENTSC